MIVIVIIILRLAFKICNALNDKKVEKMTGNILSEFDNNKINRIKKKIDANNYEGFNSDTLSDEENDEIYDFITVGR